ncbi:MAG: hypothetical protein AAFU54_07040 [Chloroflexota bacterium]
MTLPDNLIQTALLGTGHSSVPCSPAGTLVDIARFHLKARPRLYRTNQQPVPRIVQVGQRYLSDEALDHLRLIAAPCYMKSLPEWIDNVQRRNLLVPPYHLPEVLNMGYNWRHMRGPLVSIIGGHGIWLAEVAPDHYWDWVAEIIRAKNDTQPVGMGANRAVAPDESELIRQLNGRSKGLHDEHPSLKPLLGRDDAVWSYQLASAVISSLRQHLRSRTRRADRAVLSNMDQIVACTPLSLRKEMLSLLGGRFNDARQEWRGVVYQARAIFDFRASMLAALERCG